MKHPLVSVVILNYNGENLLRKFMPSVANLACPNYEVIVVDNASTDESIDFLRKFYPHFKVIRNEKNYGTAEGSNIGAKYSEGEYIFFMSNDMELDPEILNYMIKRMEEDPKIGICTCKMRRITERGERLNIIDSVGGELDIFGFPSARGINEPDYGQYDYFTEVFFSFGGAMLIRKKVFEEVGGYDSEFFTLADDIDLSWRVRLLGYKVVVEPKAFLYHRVSATLGTRFGRSFKRFVSEKNTLRMLLKNYGYLALLFILPGYFLLLLGEIFFFFLIGKPILSKSGIRAFWWNVKHLSQTLRKRKEIQARRILADRKVIKYMRKKSHKFEIFLDFLVNRSSLNWRFYFGEA